MSAAGKVSLRRVGEQLGVPPEEIAMLDALAAVRGQRPLRYLARRFGVSALRDAVMTCQGIEVRHLHSDPAPGLLERLPVQFAMNGDAIAVDYDGSELVVAVSDPSNYVVRQRVLRATGKTPVRFVYAPREEIVARAGAWRGQDETFAAVVDRTLPAMVAGRGLAREQQQDRQDEGQKLVDAIFAEALAMRATDVHVDPYRDPDTGEVGVRVRFRVNGALVTSDALSRRGVLGLELANWIARAMQTRSSGDVGRFESQDFQLHVAVGNRQVEARVHTHPASIGDRYGQVLKSTIRLLNRSLHRLDDLGFSADTLARWRELAHIPSGVTLVTGPTGAGKTTAVFATLPEIVTDEIAAFTIEDPIEYRLANAVQYEITTYDPERRMELMARALHDLRRQDADFVLVGEIRDKHSMQIAFDLAAGGVKVMATAHASSALHSVQRLLQWGVDPFLVVSTLRGVLNVRLLPRLCGSCRIAVSRSEGDVLWPETLFGRELPERGWARNHEGCTSCIHGVSGRFAIGEVLRLHDVAPQAVAEPDRLPELAAGMRSLADEAVAALADGSTYVDAVRSALST